jgi:hypothetical protein
MTLADLPGYLRAADPCACIVNGLFGKADAVVMPENKRLTGQISRTKRTGHGKGFFDFYAGPGLLLLDHDPHPNNPHPHTTPEHLAAIITDIFPAFERVARVVDYSASAEIFDDQGNRVSGDEPGHHTFVAVQDARDIPRFGDVLFKRLALAGYGYPVLSASGALLVRGIIDSAVFSPERVIFNATPTLGHGLEQRKPAPTYIPGDALDTRLLPDLTQDEQARFNALVDGWRRDVKPQAERKKHTYAQGVAQKKNLPVAQVIREIELRHAGVIHPDTLVQVEDSGRVVVLGSLVDEVRGSGMSVYILDPEEPETGHAVVMAKANGKARVRTFLHGGGDLHVSPDCRHYYGSKKLIPAEVEAVALGITGPRFKKPEYVMPQEIEHRVQSVVRDLIRNPTLPDGTPRVVVPVVSAGGGKTYGTWKEIGQHVADGLKVAGFVPTVELAREVQNAHDFPKAIRGRSNTSLNMGAPCRVIEELHKAGVDASVINRCWRSIGSLCGKPNKPEEQCRHYNQCSYNRQFWDAERQNVRLYAHNGLNQRKPALDKLNPDLAVIDENFLDEMVRVGSVSAQEVIKADEPLLTQLQEAVELAMRDQLPVLDTIRAAIPDAENSLGALRDRVAPRYPKLIPNMQTGEIVSALDGYQGAPKWFGLIVEVVRLLASEKADTQRIYQRGKYRDGVWLPADRSICWCGKRDLAQIKELPLLILDASTSPEIIRKFWPHAEIVTIRAPRRYKKVVQILSGEISNQQLMGLSTAMQPNERALRHADLFRDRVQDAVGVLQKMFGHGMVCGPKPFMEALALPDDSKRWFGNLRGIDAHKGDRWTMLTGRHQKPQHVAEAYARAIFDDDEQPLVFGFGKRPAGIRMRDGSTRYVRANYHADDRVQAVEDLFRERESEQAPDRLRVIHGDADCLLICSALPLDVTVDRVVETREDLLGDARFNKLALDHDTIPMSADWLASARPDLFPSVKAGNEWWKKFKGSSVLYEYIGRESLSKITYRTEGKRGGKPVPAMTFRRYMEDAQNDIEKLLGCKVVVAGLPPRPILSTHKSVAPPLRIVPRKVKPMKIERRILPHAQPITACAPVVGPPIVSKPHPVGQRFRTTLLRLIRERNARPAILKAVIGWP